MQLLNGVRAWSSSSSQYVQAAVRNVEEYLSEEENKHLRIPNKVETPLMTAYRPELNISPELEPKEAMYYLSLIGILRWMVELAWVDICLEVSMMSSHLAMPRKGHLDQVLHIFGYLQKYHNTELVYDPSDPMINVDTFTLWDWSSSEFGHIQGCEEKLPNMPESRGLGFTVQAKVDVDHAGDTITRRSQIGFLVYINSVLKIYWWNKKQITFESTSF